MAGSVNDAAFSDTTARHDQPPGDARTGAGDDRQRPGTTGIRAGMSGILAYWRAFAAILVLSVGIGTVNTLSLIDEQTWRGEPVHAWRYATTEGSSVFVLLLLSPLLCLLVDRTARLPAGRRLLLLAAASVPFSLAHVALMVGIRHLVWSAMGEHYNFGAEWFYEYRKDVVTFALICSAFMANRLRRPVAAARPEPVAVVPPLPASTSSLVQLFDASRPLTIDPATLTAVESAGNYVTLRFADGREQLVRCTLSAALTALEPHGFVRTHKSWVVRVAAVRELQPTGTGDWVARLTAGEVPVSRRYRDALAVLREAR